MTVADAEWMGEARFGRYEEWKPPTGELTSGPPWRVAEVRLRNGDVVKAVKGGGEFAWTHVGSPFDVVGVLPVPRI